ncbi:MAG: hypothetical protein EZS28_041831 [Streblomastix strix]|uniref:Uncharacterized protein n=1 Tax=Streblomastix strix TaxID=222440 RepID=A0A5J4TXT2_9EUKA|nr:MAG: hypothetical protein EZS28_041831 [Streblomastix strix]
MQVCQIIYYDTGVDKYGELWARLDAWSNQLIIKQTNQNLQIDPLANVLNSNAVSALPTGYSITIGCDPTLNSGYIAGQWSIYKKGDGTLNIMRTADQNTANSGLQISVDGNTLSFNGSVIAGVGATNGVSNGSVNYSSGNPILWGVNSVGTEGGFYSDGAKIYWRAKPVTLGSVPP